MIETTITKIQYDADGVQRRWSIPFPYADVKHISIYTKVGDEPTVNVVDNYDIDEDDSVVIYPTVVSGQEPLAAGTKIIIARETPETQLEDASQVHFTSKDVERGLDKLTMITQELSTTAGETMKVSANAFKAAEEAVSTANEANATAGEAKTIAEQAVGIATDAKSIAEGIDAKATQALDNSDTAVSTANSAKQIAEGVDSKATQALSNSTTALETATEAKNTAASYQGQITTIESKIPSAASETNQLADKQFVQDLTSALNFVQWVDTLPETGESKYIYAVPREETDTDGKQIAALYLWDGTRWNGAGAFSLNIDPATLATKTDLTNYLPLTGGTLSGDLNVKGNKVLDTSDKSVANGVASLDTNGKVPTEQIPVATASSLGGVKPDGTTITVTENGTISAKSSSGFDFEGTKEEFDAAVAAGTITEDSVSLITDDVSGDNVATKAELQNRVSKAGDTMSGELVMANGSNGIRFNGATADNYYYVKGQDPFISISNKNNQGIFIPINDNGKPYYYDNANSWRLLTTADIGTTIHKLNWSAMTTWNANSTAPAPGMAVFGGGGSDQNVYLKFQPAGSSQVYEINCGYNNDAGLSGTFILNTGDKAWTSNGCSGYFVPFAE